MSTNFNLMGQALLRQASEAVLDRKITKQEKKDSKQSKASNYYGLDKTSQQKTRIQQNSFDLILMRPYEEIHKRAVLKVFGSHKSRAEASFGSKNQSGDLKSISL